MYGYIDFLKGCDNMNKEIKPSKAMRGVKFYSVEDLSEILGISGYAVRDYLRKGKITAVKVGARWWISQKNLDNFLNTGNIFNKPEAVILETINEAFNEAFMQNIDKIAKKVKEINSK